MLNLTSCKSIDLKNITLLLYFIGVTFCGFSQTTVIDSLKQIVIQDKVKDTTKVRLYLSLAKEYLSVDIDSLNYYTQLAQKLSIKNNNFLLPRIYNGRGLTYVYKSQTDSAHYFFDEAIKILDKNEDKLVRATVYSNYGMLYNSLGDYDKIIEYNLMAIELLDTNYFEVSRLHYNQAVVYGQVDLINQVKKHLKLAYQTSHESNNYRIEGMTLKGLAHYAIEEKKLDSAKIYLEKGLELCKKTKSPQICYEINSKFGELYDNLGDYDKANSLLLNAKKYALIRKQPYNIMASNIFLGQHQLKKKNYDRAIGYFEEFNKLYLLNETPELGQTAFRSWAEAEYNNGGFKKSNALLEKYIIIKDSIFSRENREMLAEADAKYETEKKDKEIITQKLAIEKHEYQLQKKQSQYKIMTGLVIFLLLVSILTWFLFQQRQKRKNQEILTLKREQQVKTLETLMEGEENERLRIAKELHDGVNVDLSSIKYKLTSLLEKNNEVINEAVAMIDKSCEQVRAISHNLIPPALKNFSLIEAIEDYIGTMNTIHEPDISFHHIGDVIQLSKKVEINIFRIVQELVNNSLKHANAGEVNVQMSHRDALIQLTIEDDGKGFNKDAATADGIGLRNIQSRVDYLNAKMDFETGTKGTSYIIEINTTELS